MLLDEKQKHYANKFQIHLEASYWKLPEESDGVVDANI